jgi:hypothetical protein
MAGKAVRPEVLLSESEEHAASRVRVETLARFLDEAFRIPGEDSALDRTADRASRLSTPVMRSFIRRAR